MYIPPKSFFKTYVFDPSEQVYYRWLVIISLAVLYNYLFIIGRSSFELLQQYNPILWCTLDYICDILYLIDIFVRLRTGLLKSDIVFITNKNNSRTHNNMLLSASCLIFKLIELISFFKTCLIIHLESSN